MTKTVGTTGNAQRTGVGVSPVRVQGFPKITSEPRAEEEFLLYYIGRKKVGFDGIPSVIGNAYDSML